MFIHVLLNANINELGMLYQIYQLDVQFVSYKQGLNHIYRYI